MANSNTSERIERYCVHMETNDDSQWVSSYQTLNVKRNGKVILSESDRGEPEDQSFYRDWKWVKGALEDAYRFGLEDGRVERIRNEVSKE